MSNKAKHSQLAKASMGQFHKNEWAILGDHCEAIHAFAEQVARALWPLKVAYLDADHQPKEASSPLFYLQDQQTQWTKTFAKTDIWNTRIALLDADLVLVNGNHFAASRQLVLINTEKENSLKKRLNQDSKVDAVFVQEEQEIPAFISDLFPPKAFNYLTKTAGEIQTFFTSKIAVPELKVLIMVGGKSTRMGSDKSLINYHGKEQDLFIADLCTSLHLPFAFSCSKENSGRYESIGYEVIVDTFLNMGPKGGILSAFQAEPDRAWLTIACDLPWIDEVFFQELIEQRQPSKLATAFLSPENQMPEPLAAIWEPRAYLAGLQFLALGNSCPRKILMQSDIYAFNASNPKWLHNANTPEEAALVKSQIR
ncbi:MAG: hypothetical protein RLZZ77_1789 [Bacteroidota bacterium]